MKEATERSNLTKYISSLKSRQEEEPLVEKYVDLAKCEPLHLKNNVCKEMFMKHLAIVLSEANISNDVKCFKELLEENLFVRFVSFVRKDMKCNFLEKKLTTWFNENHLSSKKQEFSFRFGGKESNHYLKYFPQLVSFLRNSITNSSRRSRLIQVFYQSLQLRKVISYAVRISEITEENINEMLIYGTKLFKKLCAL